MREREASETATKDAPGLSRPENASDLRALASQLGNAAFGPTRACGRSPQPAALA